MKKYQISFTIFFLFLLFVLIIPKRIFAERTNEQFASSVSSCSSKWINILNSLGNPDSNYASIDLEIPTCIWNFTESFNIPPNSTLNSLTAKIYASNSGTTGVSSMSPTFNTIQVCTPPPFFPAILTNGITEYVVTAANCSGFPSLEKINSPNMGWRFFNSGKVRLSIDAVSLVIDYSPAPIPTPTPEPGPEPFLDLPWDYQEKGLSFTEAALSINSYFDHEYPLLGFGSVPEPASLSGSLITYLGGLRSNKSYSSHNGYDYGRSAKANYKDPVLAAASGSAEFSNLCAACGNMIKIDHGNGYQSIYMHLRKENLIVATPGAKIVVKARQKIGEVGFSGHVLPEDSSGSHIHFQVVEDKNKDDNFSDNILDGLTDPFGWKSDEPDPWENYLFDYFGSERSGNKSFYLWKNPIAESKETLTTSAKEISTERFKFSFPSNSTINPLTIKLTPLPIINYSNNLSSLGSTINAEATDNTGNSVTSFLEPFQLTIDFSIIDISSYKPESLNIYSSKDGSAWNKELTMVDFINKKATTNLTHFTQFALMGEKKDSNPPNTNIVLNGITGQDNWYRSDIEAIITANDNTDGSGISYSAYKLDTSDWEEYSGNIIVSEEGEHTIEFFSEDNDGNIEEIKQVKFNIDKTSPIINIETDKATLWPANGKLVPVAITGSSSDANLEKTTIVVVDEYNEIEPIIANFGETVNLKASRKGNDKDGRTYTITASAIDKAGNVANAETKVVVPQNDSKLKDFLLALLLRLIRGIN